MFPWDIPRRFDQAVVESLLKTFLETHIVSEVEPDLYPFILFRVSRYVEGSELL